MGGHNSSRWRRYIPRHTVEKSIRLNIAMLTQRVQLGPACLAAGVLELPPNGDRISFYLTGLELTLVYQAYRPRDGWLDQSEAIRLDTTRPHYGGLRWWFVCPSCAERCTSLYLDRQVGYFCCRACANLVYRSQQTHDKTLDKYVRMPWLIDKAFLAVSPDNASLPQLMHTLKMLNIYTRLQCRAADRAQRRHHA